MSVETLVLLVLFLVLPLVQWLVRATRQRNRRVPEPAGSRSPRTPARTPPPELAVPPLPDATPHAASDAQHARSRKPEPHASGPVTPALTRHRTMGQRTAVGLRTRRDLRRAVALVAVLGPCRASSPYGSPEQAGRA